MVKGSANHKHFLGSMKGVREGKREDVATVYLIIRIVFLKVKYSLEKVWKSLLLCLEEQHPIPHAASASFCNMKQIGSSTFL